MNKYKEALDEIKNIVLDKSGDGYRTAKYLQNFYYSSCETLQELVDKVDSFEWIPFTFDEEGVLNCEFPDVDEEILVSDGDSVWQDTWCEADEGYELESGIEIEDLAWRQLPKPYEENQNENNC